MYICVLVCILVYVHSTIVLYIPWYPRVRYIRYILIYYNIIYGLGILGYPGTWYSTIYTILYIYTSMVLYSVYSGIRILIPGILIRYIRVITGTVYTYNTVCTVLCFCGGKSKYLNLWLNG